MQYRRLGRTGLSVSILSLGSGGPNRFGQSRYVSRRFIQQLVRQALDHGINFFDTASTYEHSESLLGAALAGVPRDDYHVASKIPAMNGEALVDAVNLRRLVERSLRRLGVRELDLLQLHGIHPASYTQTRDCLIPELRKLQAEGKVRYIGITEASQLDLRHAMLTRALQDDLFDTVMVAYHLSNPSAEDEVFPLAQARDVGVIGMAAARHQVCRGVSARLRLLPRIAASFFQSPPGPGRWRHRLRDGFSIISRSGPRQPLPVTRKCGGNPLIMPSAAYSFAISHPAVATVLTGTTDRIHLRKNLEAVLAPMLTAEEIQLLRDMPD
jgi:aryl-alcohol dehydrogenase-like predicted oxidoreductase